MASDSGDGAVGTGRGEAVRAVGRNGAALSGCRRAVLTAHLMRGRGAARTAGSDRWDPLVSVFRIKNTPGRK
jgi:hypothetical protein